MTATSRAVFAIHDRRAVVSSRLFHQKVKARDCRGAIVALIIDHVVCSEAAAVRLITEFLCDLVDTSFDTEAVEDYIFVGTRIAPDIVCDLLFRAVRRYLDSRVLGWRCSPCAVLFLAQLFSAEHGGCSACAFKQLDQEVVRECALGPANPISVISVLAAIATDLPCVSLIPKYMYYVSFRHRQTYEAAVAHFNHSISRPAVEHAALQIARPRMLEICIALQHLRLPALVTVLLIEEACWLAGTEFRRAHTWAIAAKVKHWHDKNPASVACRLDEM